MTYPPTTHTPKALVRDIRQEKAHAKGTVQIKVSQLAVWLEKFAAANQDDKHAASLCTSIVPWLERCMKACGADQHTKIAAPVLKRASLEIHAIEEIRISIIGPNPSTPDAWASMWVYFDALMDDVVTLWEGGRTQCWKSLIANIELLAEYLLSMSADRDGAEVCGATIYERAMERTGWA